MAQLYSCCILLVTALTVNGASLGFNSRTGKALSESVTSGGSFSIVNNNGKVEIIMNGKPVDLNEATLVEENDEYKVLEPKGIPGARIKVYNDGKIDVNFGGSHISQMSPEMAEAQAAQVAKAMQELQDKIKRMNERMKQIFSNNFPFGSSRPYQF